MLAEPSDPYADTFFGPPFDILTTKDTHARPGSSAKARTGPDATYETIEQLRRSLHEDYFLYEFTSRQLQCQARACGLAPPFP